MDEDEYIYKQFNELFLPMNKNIIIYGTGIRTEHLLSRIDSPYIVGLMDFKKNGKFIQGLKVLDYDEVDNVEDAIIVIIARSSVVNLIFKRLLEHYGENLKPVYNINGQFLENHNNKDFIEECFALKKEEVIKKIDDSDIISFDVFDTLICRNIMRPYDVFDIVQACSENEIKNYSFERKKAESQLVNPTIYEIYDQMGKNLGFEPQIMHKLMLIELDIDKKLLSQRPDVCNLMKYAKDKGKKIVLISDMYYTSEIINNILAELGIDGYDSIYVSSEYKVKKNEGLYKYVIEREKLDKWLHIGDDDYSDVISAKQAGAEIYKIYSTIEMLERSVYSVAVDKCVTIEHSIILGRFASTIYCNVFGSYSSNGKIGVSKDESIINTIFSPIVYKFTVWFSQKSLDTNIELSTFSSKEDCLLKKIYEKLRREYFFRRQYPDSNDGDILYRYSMNNTNEDSNIYIYYLLANILSSCVRSLNYVDIDERWFLYNRLNNILNINDYRIDYCKITNYCNYMFDLMPVLSKWQNDINIYETILGFFQKTT